MSLHSWPNPDLVGSRSPRAQAASVVLTPGGAASPSPPSTPPQSRRATHPYDPYDIPVSRSGRPLRRSRLQGARLAAFLTASVCLTSLLLLVVQSLFGVSSISTVLKLHFLHTCRDEPDLEAKVRLVLPLRQLQAGNDSCKALVSALINGYEPIIVGWDVGESTNATENRLAEAKAIEGYLRSLPWDTSLIDPKSHPDRVLVMDPRTAWLQLPPVWLVSRLDETRGGIVMAGAGNCQEENDSESLSWECVVDPNMPLTAIAGSIGDMHKIFAMRAGMMRTSAPIWSASASRPSANSSASNARPPSPSPLIDTTSRIFSSTIDPVCWNRNASETLAGWNSSSRPWLVPIGHYSPDALLGPPPQPELVSQRTSSSHASSPVQFATATAPQASVASTEQEHVVASVIYRSDRPACQLVNSPDNPPWGNFGGPPPQLLVDTRTGQVPVVVVRPPSSMSSSSSSSSSDDAHSPPDDDDVGAPFSELWEQTWFGAAYDPSMLSSGSNGGGDAPSTSPPPTTTTSDDRGSPAWRPIIRQRLSTSKQQQQQQVGMYALDRGEVAFVSLEEICAGRGASGRGA